VRCVTRTARAPNASPAAANETPRSYRTAATSSLPLGKIGDRLQVHRTSVTNLIDGLETAGHARRVPHPTDRRTTLAEITDRGREAAHAASEALNAMTFGTTPLRKAELDTLAEILRRLRIDAGDFTM
jgi:DNA-binding MarR family transcriptional regulator